MTRWQRATWRRVGPTCPPLPRHRPHEYSHAPWLRLTTILFLVWSLLPLLLVVVFSFNAAPSISRWEGFSLGWWVGDAGDQVSIVYDPVLRRALVHSIFLAFWTTVIAVPMGTAFALGVRGWNSRIARAALAVMLVTLLLPRIALAEAMYLTFLEPLRHFPFGDLGWFGTPGQLVGLVTIMVPFVT
jgi:spermidine/putrescine transport system permease protein